MHYSFSTRMQGVHPSAIREIFKVLEDPTVISFAAGSPSPETFPAAQLGELSQALFTTQYAQAFQYGISEGYGPLREQTAARLKTKYHTGCDTDAILITSGGQQALDLSVKVLANEGDTILCEDPSFVGALNGIRSYGVNLQGVPMDDEGMDTDALEEILKSGGGYKLVYTIPTFQNPTGVTMSAARRRHLMALASQYDLILLEDNPYHELRYSGDALPTLKSMDTEGRVIYMGSYSKVIAPGIRMGYVCAHKDLIAKMTVAKQVADVHTNQFFQMLVSSYLTHCDIDEHIAQCRQLYRTKRDRMLSHEPAFGGRISFTHPDGGLFLWCRLPDGGDSDAFGRAAIARKVAIVPGSAFASVSNAVSPGFRLNFSLPATEQIDAGMAVLAALSRDFAK